MEITCLQMDVLISFYIDGELSESLKAKVEEHLRECPVCRAKLNIIDSLFGDVKKKLCPEEKEVFSTNTHSSKQYQFLKKNELPEEENVKIRKYTIGNKKARKELEETYKIRKILKDSFRKSKAESKPDFIKKVMKSAEFDDKTELEFNPLISVGFAFIMTVILISAIVIYMLSL